MTTNETTRKQILVRSKWAALAVFIVCLILAAISAKSSLFWLWFMIGTAALFLFNAARLQLKARG